MNVFFSVLPRDVICAVYGNSFLPDECQ